MVRMTAMLTLTLLSLCMGPVSTIKRLNHMLDLTSTSFGQTFPHNGLMLLYWFTSHTDFTDEDAIVPKDFDPTMADYGCTVYRNSEGIFPRIPRKAEDESYYIIGNLKKAGAKFPTYVNQDYYNAYCDLKESQYSTTRDGTSKNRDRIIFRLKTLSSSFIIKDVYITQTTATGLHLSHTQTYEVTVQLLKEISDIMKHKAAILCPSMKSKEEQAHSMFEESNLAWFLTLADYDVSLRELCLRSAHCSDYTHEVGGCRNSLHCVPGSKYGEICDWSPISLTVGTTDEGQAVLNWANVPDTRVEEEGLVVALFENDHSSVALTEKAVDGLTLGSFSTEINLDAGLQVRLLLKPNETLWRGPELDDANGKTPVILNAYGSIQLFARNGTAGVRFYVKKSYDWKVKFSGWYIGYHLTASSSYSAYVYMQNFVQKADNQLPKFDVYEYVYNDYKIRSSAFLQVKNSVVVFVTSLDSEGRCPLPCRCEGTLRYCDKAGLAAVPQDLIGSSGLSLRYNHLLCLPQAALSRLNTLQWLFLGHNQIQSLDERAFLGLRRLKELELSVNHLRLLPNRTFRPLPNLRLLDLSTNQVSALSASQFRGLRKLMVLRLRRNWLTSLPVRVFQDLRKLRVLDLGENRLQTLARNAFVGLLSLTELRLDRNRLNRVNLGLFARLTSLRSLDLSQNKAAWLGRTLHWHWASLEHLDLSRNRLEWVEPTAFHGVPRLKSLLLHSNHLQVLDLNILQNWVSLENLTLSGNPWDCGRNICTLAAWLGHYRGRRDNGPVCSMPEEAEGENVLDAVHAFQTCQPHVLDLNTERNITVDINTNTEMDITVETDTVVIATEPEWYIVTETTEQIYMEEHKEEEDEEDQLD
ncbi:uncharacterized protein LOC134066533 [Sardina pilchardus]|uniref:uncharacterized protein LOC134066533 n=1 Tax=Sardina pilchardus TaxID=27697 RepID=UPI002E10F984